MCLGVQREKFYWLSDINKVTKNWGFCRWPHSLCLPVRIRSSAHHADKLHWCLNNIGLDKHKVLSILKSAASSGCWCKTAYDVTIDISVDVTYLFLQCPFVTKRGNVDSNHCLMTSHYIWNNESHTYEVCHLLTEKKVDKTLFILWQWKRDNLPPTMSCSFKSTKVTKLSALSSGTPWTSKRSLKLQFSTPSSKMFFWKFTMDKCKLLRTILVWKLFFWFMICLMQQISVKVEPKNDKRGLVIRPWWYKQDKCLV